jgi:UDP-2,4-diacetamido-2,4,6-trideoxy-beta-L-altropyranose hydrolase
MRVTFRVDASLQIGTGHVMRCLTLADALRERGAECSFVCRPHAGNLLNLIAQRGHNAFALKEPQEYLKESHDLAHAGWLGADWHQDAKQTREVLNGQECDWLVVDHYALDQRWELTMRDVVGSIMVIDDLADRQHECDVLLDQTLGRQTEDYRLLVPDFCVLLCGSQYALLRPEFAALREYSLKRRVQPALKNLLITMGGVDKDNATGAVLEVLRTCWLPKDCRLTVVMGQTAPRLQEIKTLANYMPRPTRVLVGVSEMAQLMADSDLAIGAAGATSWERCCLGVPAIMLLLAENQNKVGAELELSGSAKLIRPGQVMASQLTKLLLLIGRNPEKLLSMSVCAAQVTDGIGANVVIGHMCSSVH